MDAGYFFPAWLRKTAVDSNRNATDMKLAFSQPTTSIYPHIPPRLLSMPYGTGACELHPSKVDVRDLLPEMLKPSTPSSIFRQGI